MTSPRNSRRASHQRRARHVERTDAGDESHESCERRTSHFSRRRMDVSARSRREAPRRFLALLRARDATGRHTRGNARHAMGHGIPYTTRTCRPPFLSKLDVDATGATRARDEGPRLSHHSDMLDGSSLTLSVSCSHAVHTWRHAADRLTRGDGCSLKARRRSRPSWYRPHRPLASRSLSRDTWMRRRECQRALADAFDQTRMETRCTGLCSSAPS